MRGDGSGKGGIGQDFQEDAGVTVMGILVYSQHVKKIKCLLGYFFWARAAGHRLAVLRLIRNHWR